MRNNRGFAFIILFLVIVAIAAAAVTPIIMNGIWYHSISDHEKAFFIADSGIKYYIKSQNLGSDNNWSDNNTNDCANNTPFTKSFGGGTNNFKVCTTHANPASTDPAFFGDPKNTIILTSVGQVTTGAVTLRRTVRYTVKSSGAAAFDGQSVIYGAGSATFDHINNGTINGNINLAGSFIDIKSKKLEINGSVNQNQANVSIPGVNWSYWQAQAAAAGAGHVINVTAASPTYTFGGISYSGIYYINCTDCAAGNAIVNNNNMVFNGTLVAKGNITFGSANNVSFTPAVTALGTNPAVVAGGNVNIGSGNNVIFNGAVYAFQNLIMGQTNNLTLNGGALIFGDDLTADHTNNVILNTGARTDGSGFIGGEQGTGTTSVSYFVEVTP